MSRAFAITGLIIVALSGVAVAQNMPAGVPSATPDPQFINSAIAVLQQQRNSALDQVAQAQAQLTVVQGQLASAKKELEDLRAAQKPVEPEKNYTPVPEEK